MWWISEGGRAASCGQAVIDRTYWRLIDHSCGQADRYAVAVAATGAGVLCDVFRDESTRGTCTNNA